MVMIMIRITKMFNDNKTIVMIMIITRMMTKIRTIVVFITMIMILVS